LVIFLSIAADDMRFHNAAKFGATVHTMRTPLKQ